MACPRIDFYKVLGSAKELCDDIFKEQDIEDSKPKPHCVPWWKPKDKGLVLFKNYSITALKP